MTREILFRGKSVDDGEWVYGSYLQRYNRSVDDEWLEHYIVDDLGYEYEVNPETVGQDTGLLDKNGNKIFDGDKIRLSSEWSICGNIPREGIIVWLNDKAMYVIVQERNINDVWHHHTELHNLPIYNYEVIGNIHDKEATNND